MLLRLAPRVVAGVTRPGRWSSRQRPPKVTLYHLAITFAASGSNRYPGSARRRHPRLERSRVEKPAADISDAEGRQAVLNRHQPEQLIHVEVRVGFLTQRKADEGRRRKSSDQDIVVGDHLCRAASREHHGSRRVPVDSRVARSILSFGWSLKMRRRPPASSTALRMKAGDPRAGISPSAATCTPARSVDRGSRCCKIAGSHRNWVFSSRRSSRGAHFFG